MSFTGTLDKCMACDETVHVVDMMTLEGTPYHISCFEGSCCKGSLSHLNGLKKINKKARGKEKNSKISNVSFRVIITKCFLNRAHLTLTAKQVRRIIWPKIPSNPQIKLLIRDGTGIKKWTISSRLIHHRQRIRFDVGLIEFLRGNNLKIEDILTFKKLKKGKSNSDCVEFGIHIHRWDTNTDDYKNVTLCSQCPSSH